MALSVSPVCMLLSGDGVPCLPSSEFLFSFFLIAQRCLVTHFYGVLGGPRDSIGRCVDSSQSWSLLALRSSRLLLTGGGLARLPYVYVGEPSLLVLELWSLRLSCPVVLQIYVVVVWHENQIWQRRRFLLALLWFQPSFSSFH